MSGVLPLLKETYASWMSHKAPKMGAALAYYTIFSLAPILIITLSIVSMVFGPEAARGELVAQFEQLVGKAGAEIIKTILTENATHKAAGILATILGFVTLLFGASGVFAEVQDSMNTIWEVKARTGGGLLGMIKDRFLSFVMVLGTGFLLLVSLSLSAAIAALSKYLGDRLPGSSVVWESANFVVTFGVIAVLFAMIFRILPDVRIEWRDVWFGAVVTALLFDVGKFLLGLYIGRSAIASSYGAAGSVVILLFWIYYSAQILFFGAELTRAYAARLGSHQQDPALADARD